MEDHWSIFVVPALSLLFAAPILRAASSASVGKGIAGALALLIVATTPLSVHGKAWISPIDAKYREKNGGLYLKYRQARALLNRWSGQPEYLQQADTLLNAIIESDPDYAPAYREFARLYMMGGYIIGDRHHASSMESAEFFIHRALAIEPVYADAYVLLGYVHTGTGRYDEAQAALERAEEIGTEIPWLDLNWAGLLEKRGQFDAAHQRYLKVANADPVDRKSYSSALDGLKKYALRRGDYPAADAWYRKMIEYDPASPWNLGNYASFRLFMLGDEEGAIVYGERALEKMDYGAGRMTLASALYVKWARVLERGGSEEEAAPLFERARALHPGLSKVIRETFMRERTRFAARKLLFKMVGDLFRSLW